jgi:hypothetical protein
VRRFAGQHRRHAGNPKPIGDGRVTATFEVTAAGALDSVGDVHELIKMLAEPDASLFVLVLKRFVEDPQRSANAIFVLATLVQMHEKDTGDEDTARRSGFERLDTALRNLAAEAAE